MLKRTKLTPEDLQNENDFELLTEVSHQKLREFVIAQVNEEKYIIRIYSIYQVIMMALLAYWLLDGIILFRKGNPSPLIGLGIAVLFSFSCANCYPRTSTCLGLPANRSAKNFVWRNPGEVYFLCFGRSPGNCFPGFPYCCISSVCCR